MNSRTLILCLFALVALFFVAHAVPDEEFCMDEQDQTSTSYQSVPNMKLFKKHSSIAFTPAVADTCEADGPFEDDTITIKVSVTTDGSEENDYPEFDWDEGFACLHEGGDNPVNCDEISQFDKALSTGASTRTATYSALTRETRTVSIVLQNEAGLSEIYTYEVVPDWTQEPELTVSTVTNTQLMCDGDEIMYGASFVAEFNPVLESTVCINDECSETAPHTFTGLELTEGELSNFPFNYTASNCAGDLNDDSTAQGEKLTFGFSFSDPQQVSGLEDEEPTITVRFSLDEIRSTQIYTGFLDDINVFLGEDECTVGAGFDTDGDVDYITAQCTITVTGETVQGHVNGTSCLFENLEYSIDTVFRTPAFSVSQGSFLCPSDQSSNFTFTVTSDDNEPLEIVTPFDEILLENKHDSEEYSEFQEEVNFPVTFTAKFNLTGDYEESTVSLEEPRLPALDAVDDVSFVHTVKCENQRNVQINSDVTKYADYFTWDGTTVTSSLEFTGCVIIDAETDEDDCGEMTIAYHADDETYTASRSTIVIDTDVSYDLVITVEYIGCEDFEEDAVDADFSIPALSLGYGIEFVDSYEKVCSTNECHRDGVTNIAVLVKNGGNVVDNIQGIGVRTCEGDACTPSSGNTRYTTSYNPDEDPVEKFYRAESYITDGDCPVPPDTDETTDDERIKDHTATYETYTLELPSESSYSVSVSVKDEDQCIAAIKFGTNGFDTARDDYYYCVVDGEVGGEVCGPVAGNWFELSPAGVEQEVNVTDLASTTFHVHAYPSRCYHNMMQPNIFFENTGSFKSRSFSFPSPDFPADVDEVDLDVEYNDRTCELTSVIVDLKGSVEYTDEVEICIDAGCFTAPYNDEDKFTITDPAVLALVNNGQSVNVVITATGKCGAENTVLDLGTVTPSWPCDDSESESESGSGSSGSNSKSDSSSSEPQPGPSSASSAAISVLALIVAVFVVLF